MERMGMQLIDTVIENFLHSHRAMTEEGNMIKDCLFFGPNFDGKQKYVMFLEAVSVVEYTSSIDDTLYTNIAHGLGLSANNRCD